MPKPLVISSAAGLLVCAVCLGLAVRIGGDDIFHDARALEPMKPLIDMASHKAWAWNGGDTLAKTLQGSALRYRCLLGGYVDGMASVHRLSLCY